MHAKNICKCGATIHPGYMPSVLCEDCWVEELIRLNIESDVVPFSMRVADPNTPSIRRGRAPNISPQIALDA